MQEQQFLWDNGSQLYACRVAEEVSGVEFNHYECISLMWGLFTILWGGDVGHTWLLLRTSYSLYDENNTCVWIPRTACCKLRFIFSIASSCHSSRLWCSWIGSQGLVMKRRVSGLEVLGLICSHLGKCASLPLLWDSVSVSSGEVHILMSC